MSGHKNKLHVKMEIVIIITKFKLLMKIKYLYIYHKLFSLIYYFDCDKLKDKMVVVKV